MRRFDEHNKHWQSLEFFKEQDPHLCGLKQQQLVNDSDLIYELPNSVPGIYTLSGGRQIGKTTLLKQWMYYLLAEKKASVRDIFFMVGDIIEDYVSLIQLVNQYLTGRLSEELCFLIIDEVSYIKNWDRGIKYLADAGKFQNVIVVLTGSDNVFIKEALMRFPGRGGKASKREFHLYPLSFYDFIRLKNIQDINSALLFKEFDSYLIHGGFLTAINDYAQYQKISVATYNTYSDWVRGDFVKRGKSEAYLKEVLRAIIKTYGTQVTWNALADHTSINHHDTVRQYIELLESMDVLFIQHALLEDKLVAAPKKAKKIIFKDPFMFHALRRWTDQPEDEEIIPSLVESCVVSQYQRFYSCYYIKAEGEVDLAYIHNDRFWPIEVKWRNQDRPKDLKQIAKYKNGLILNKYEQVGTVNSIPTRPLPVHIYDSYKRERLQQISDAGTPDVEKIKSIERILERMSLLWEKEDTGNAVLFTNNCFSYALGLHETDYLQLVKNYYDDTGVGNSYFANSSFIDFLLKRGILEQIHEPSMGDLIIYFDDENKPTHAGIIKECASSQVQLVESKWGSIRALFQHKIWDVPVSYGNIIKYYLVPDLEITKQQFIDFCYTLKSPDICFTGKKPKTLPSHR